MLGKVFFFLRWLFFPSLTIICFNKWLGLNGSKFIQNEVFSNEVIVPRDGACQDALWNKWEIINLRIFCLKKVKLDERIKWNAIRTHLWRDVKPIMVDKNCLYICESFKFSILIILCLHFRLLFKDQPQNSVPIKATLPEYGRMNYLNL